MLIKIHTSDVHFTLPIPNFILLNQYACYLISKMIKNSDFAINIEPEELRPLIDELVRLKKIHGSLTLIEIDSAKGEHIKIML